MVCIYWWDVEEQKNRICVKRFFKYNYNKKYYYHSIVLISDIASFEKNKTWGFVDKDMLQSSEQINDIIPQIIQFQKDNIN